MSQDQRLDSVAELTMGQAPAGESYNAHGNGLPLIAGAGDFGELHPEPKKYTTAPGKTCQAGDIILGIRATIGKKVLADRQYCLGRGVAGLRARPGLDGRYLWHWLTHAEPSLATRAKGATFKQVNRQDIGSLNIRLPRVPEQQRIAEILDAAQTLRAKRRDALARLDTLTHSIFFDTFGDPVTNPNKMHKQPLGDLLKLKSGKFLSSAKMVDSGPYSVLGGNGINGSHDQYMFKDPQIVIGRVGVYCGCVHASPPKSWVTDNALYVSEWSPRLRFEYLLHALMHARLNQYANQSGQPLVSGSRIYPVAILVPPEDLQIAFEKRLATTKRLRRLDEAAVSTVEALFAALQHRSFHRGPQPCAAS